MAVPARDAHSEAMRKQQTPSEPAGLEELLERWVADGLLTAEQAAQIEAAEHVRATAPPPAVTTIPGAPPAGRRSLMSEALGYVGGVLMIAAVVLLITWYWEDMGVGVRVGLVAGAAVLALAAGLAVPHRLGDAGTRLRAVFWLISVMAFAGTLGLIGAEVLDWQGGDDAVLLAAAGTIPYAAALWWRQRSVLQQLGLFGALVMTAGTAATNIDPDEGIAAGLAVWGLGAAWFALVVAGLVTPKRTGYVLASIAAVFGASITMSEGWGHLLALATVAALITVAVLISDLAVLAIGALGAAQILPRSLAEYLPGTIAVPLGLLVAGLILVIVAVRITRDRSDPDGPGGGFTEPSRSRRSTRHRRVRH